ncbi:hypothetical protein CYQ88_07490 [Hydrogenovibrio sp. SC-1]|uniref:YceI family protein n=1 Tax=Hydrogenovibrio sp. SC-1 TaxID=2065820 RepID=UPI000C7B2572|nr:YceI family protein [Hydrogenovibrio sp. SC-1]PLA74214.1 hypothetical protein CYQ88_07490 [Hydrogenovibrio sp. SC-1]
MNKSFLKVLALTATLSLFSTTSHAADQYQIDTKGMHASIQFKIKHLGYSWLKGRFEKFSGDFSYDATQISNSQVSVNIDTASVNSNHAERDKHLRSDDFLDVKKYPTATFKSSSITEQADGSLKIKGQLTLHGVTKAIEIQASKVGEGKDPWGGYRAGFSGSTRLKLADYGITYNLGPASTHVDLSLEIEGVRQ